MRLRRRSSRPLLGNVLRSARPSLRLYDLELDSTILEEDGELNNPACWLGRSRNAAESASLFLLQSEGLPLHVRLVPKVFSRAGV